jgi:hypothetical protein
MKIINMNKLEKDILKEYYRLSINDPEGAWAPYYPCIAKIANGDAGVAYIVCKILKKRKFLECKNNIIGAPSYWPTITGEVAIANEIMNT